jgi:hypothetical protein
MTDLDVQDAAAKADDMANPALLAASMIEERAPDIVEALNEMPPELAVAVLLRAPKVMNPKCSPILNADVLLSLVPDLVQLGKLPLL